MARDSNLMTLLCAMAGAGLLLLSAFLLFLFFIQVWPAPWASDEVLVFTKRELVVNVLAIILLIGGSGVSFLFIGLRWHGLKQQVIDQRQVHNILQERVAILNEQATTPSRKKPTYPDGLTQREMDVIRLISAGKTDREIAHELLISNSTVGNHVSNILSKIGAANRVEAAAYAFRNSLV